MPKTKKERGKFYLFFTQAVVFKRGETEIKVPIFGALKIILLLGIFTLILYSSFECAGCEHNAHDVPIKKTVGGGIE